MCNYLSQSAACVTSMWPIILIGLLAVVGCFMWAMIHHMNKD